jgi:hypothetical protein
MSEKIKKLKKKTAGDRSGTSPMLLSELIDAVKEDLIVSSESRSNESVQPLFEIKNVTIETEVTAQRKIKTGAKGSIVLLTVDANGEQTNVTKHKISVNLNFLDSPASLRIRMRGASAAAPKKVKKDSKK